MKAKRIFAILLVLCIFVGITGCKTNPTETSSNLSNNIVNSDFIDLDDDSNATDSSDTQDNSSDNSSDASQEGTTSSGSNNEQSENPSSTNKKVKDTAVRDLGGREITFMTIWEEPEKGTSSFNNAYWKKKTEIERKFNCKFNFVYGTGNWYDTWVSSVLAGKPSADIICAKDDPFSPIKEGLFYNLSSLNQFDFSEDKWLKVISEMGTVDNKQYLMHASKYEPENIVLYNKDMFKKYGAEDLYTLQKNGSLTLDKFVEIATYLKNKSGKPSILPGIQVFSSHTWFARAYGGASMSRTANTLQFHSTVNSTAVKNGYERAQSLLNSGVIVKEVDTTNWMWSREQFAKGNYPIVFEGDLETALLDSNFDVGACLMPTTDGGTVSITDNLIWCAMPHNVKKPEEVALVFDQMAEVIFSVDYKTRFQDIASDDVMEMINKQASQQQQGKGLTIDYSCIFVNDLWTNGVGDAMRQMDSGEISPAQAILTVENIYNSQITNKFGK